MSRFQLIFTGILVFCAVVGAVLFAVVRSNNSAAAPRLTMWGTLPSASMAKFFSDLSLTYSDTVNVDYLEKDSASFESELVSALASGKGPDMVVLPHDLVVRQLDKFYLVPFQNYSERTFKDSFIEGSELYLSPSGTIAFPFSVDPIVMYWNRDIFSDAGVSLPPTAWTELYTAAPRIIQKDAAGNITRSLVAFGSAGNVSRFKEVLSLLAIQAGTPIVSRDSNGYLSSVLAMQGQGVPPAEQALNFYTEFSNPVKPAYSWNGSLQQDRSAFIAGKLALYFGYASEILSIRAANPNLNFDVAVVPQTSGRKSTFGKMTGIALLKSSPNIASAYVAATTMTGKDAQALWNTASGYPPVRRDLLVSMPASAYQAVFYQSALMSRAWLDPYKQGTDDIFARLVQNVTSGRMRTSEAVKAASVEIDSLLR